MTADHQPPRERRARSWLGLLLIGTGAFLAGDTVERLQLAWAFVERWWPWALLGLAFINLARSILRIESVLAPGLLAAVAAIVLALRHGIATHTVLDIALPLALTFAGAALLLSIGAKSEKSWTRVLMTGRVAPTDPVTGVLRPRAVLGEVRVNLTTLKEPSGELTVHATAVLGHVHFEIPSAWHVVVDAEGAVLTSLRDSKDNGDESGRHVRLSILGFCGIVTVVRSG